MLSRAHFPYFFKTAVIEKPPITQAKKGHSRESFSSRDCLGTANASFFPWAREEFICTIVPVDTLHLHRLNYMSREMT